MILSAGTEFGYNKYINRVPLDHGWLTLPVHQDHSHTAIKDMLVANDRQRLGKLSKSVAQRFTGKANKYPSRAKDIAEYVAALKGGEPLFEVNVTLLRMVNDSFFEGQVHFEIDMEVPNPDFTVTQRLVYRMLNSPLVKSKPRSKIVYQAGSGALDYLKVEEVPRLITMYSQCMVSGTPRDTFLSKGVQEADPKMYAIMTGSPNFVGVGILEYVE